MQVSYSWLKELVDFDWSPEELAERMTLSGAEAEVEYLTDIPFDNIVIGHILECDPVPETDHLQECIVDNGREKIQVVCGAPNAAKGQKIVLAEVGAELKGGLKIKKAKLRGVESNGMICSERELGISEDHSGIMILDEKAPVGKPFFKTMGLDDAIIKLDLTPNRPDLMSVTGVARDIACLAGRKMKRPEFKLGEKSDKADNYIKIKIDDPEACPRYGARMIMNLKIGESPWWIKRKLMLCGFRPISNVVDITNLVLMETGHPLHAFDYDTLKNKEIVVRRAKNKEKFTTLDGKEHVMSPDVLLITDGKDPIGTAGIMGGLDSEVSDNTVNVLLEAAYFDPRTTRKGRQNLGIQSEAQVRFEKKADPNMVPYALDRASALMAEYAGGEVLSGIVDCYPNRIGPEKIALRPDYANHLLGTDISKKRMIEILEGIEFDVEDKGEYLDVTVPTFTGDITREVDLIEEIIRLEGFDSVPDCDENKGPLFAKYPEDEKFKDDIRRVMTGLGFDEIYSGGLADPKILSKITGRDDAIRVINPIAEDLTVMEGSAIYTLLKSAANNISHRNIELRLFVIAKVYIPGKAPTEKYELGLLVSGKSPDSWYGKGSDLGFHDLKGAFDTLTGIRQLPALDYKPNKVLPLSDNMSFGIELDGREIGCIGEVSKELGKLFGFKQNVYLAAVDLDELMKLEGSVEEYIPLPKFPAAPRDMAVVVDESVRVGEMIKEISKNGAQILEKVDLFDLFRGKQIGEGKKSLAFSMVYRSPERSLEAGEVQKIHNNIAEVLKKKFGAEIREG